MNKFEIHINDKTFIPSVSKFKGGEIRVNVNFNVADITGDLSMVRIVANLFNSDDVMTLVMITDAIEQQMPYSRIRLTLPYVPYGRQDRICNPGEAFSLKAFARIINTQGYSSIVTYDPHSSVTISLIDRIIGTGRAELLESEGSTVMSYLRSQGKPVYLVSPDKGAKDKTLEIYTKFPYDFAGCIFADKARNMADGSITKMEVTIPTGVDLSNAILLVTDDICDGGRTFIELAKNLPKCAELNLFVTHGIFSYGQEELKKYYSNIWSITNFGYEWSNANNCYQNERLA